MLSDALKGRRADFFLGKKRNALNKKEAILGEFFLFILMFVVFFAWLHHKTKGFKNIIVNNPGCQGCCNQTDWNTNQMWKNKEDLDDPSIPGNPGYYDW